MKYSSARQQFCQISDIGDIKNAGSYSYNPSTEEYIVSGSGNNSWHEKDEFCFLWSKAQGNIILYSLLKFLESGHNPYPKAGLMIRKTLEPQSPYVSVSLQANGQVFMHYRSKSDPISKEIPDIRDLLSILQIEKSDDNFVIKACKKGFPLEKTGETYIDFGSGEFYVGLFVCSCNPDMIKKVSFLNTRLSIPANPNFVPYTDYIGSQIEILDIETGLRKLVFKTPENLEAPNWSPDGKFLVLNGKGKLYRYNFETGTLNTIYTDFANSNNNDHGIAPDGKRLVISHHLADLPQGQNSIIFTLPIEGGVPKRVTRNGPSYWHGWSPDGKYLIYTANRNNQWDIYKIPAEGGDEIQLTNNKGLDDGSQYSANGKYVWFNSNRSGSMEIWRMKADGSEQTQITNDEYQNWFAHESPDSKKIILLSYLSDIDLSDHPYYKHVMLRIMNANELQPKVIAHLYGGQGTINVPSWSPDSKKVAFVSNTQLIK